MASKDASFTTGGTISPEATGMLETFWTRTSDDIRKLSANDFKTQELPLARIKKIMKLDEDVKMISAEAPVLFAKAAEIFISELSLRAWMHTEENKRRTLQRNDIAMAISKFDQFDFLIDIVPRDELKPAKRSDETVQRTSMMPDQVQYYFQLAQQTQAALQQQQQQQTTTPVAATAQPAAAATTVPTTVSPTPTAVQTPATQLQGPIVQQLGQQLQLQLQDQNQGQQQQIIQVQLPQQQQTSQVLHQVVTATGEIQNIPLHLSPEQLQALQLQVQGKQPGQPIVIQTATTQNSDQVQLSQTQPMFQIQQVSGPQVFIQQAEDAQQVETQEG